MKKWISVFALFLFIGIANSHAADTLTTSSGLKYIPLKEGEGKRVYANRIIHVQYIGYFEDGTVFDQSEEVFTFVSGRREVISGWEEGIRLMREGAFYRFIVPPHLAYGKRGYKGVIPPNTTLIFDIKLIKVEQL